MKITKSQLKQIIKEELEGTDEYWLGTDHREVLIKGYGRMTVDQIKESLRQRLSEMMEGATNKDFSFLDHQMENGVFVAMYEALRDNDALDPRANPDEVDPDWERN